MTNELIAPLSEPICEAVTLVLDGSITRDPGRVARRRLATGLRDALARPVKGWHVRHVPGSDLPEYDITPPDGETIAVNDAWNLSYALAALPDVSHAEPAVAVIQDAAPAIAVEPTPDTEESGPLAAPAFENCADEKPPAAVDPNDIDWSPRLVDAPCAWQLEPPPPEPGFPPGQRRGKGIRIGHPDSGYRRHPDFFAEPPGQPTRVFRDLERDFVDRDKVAENADGGHGLNTGAVIMSSDLTGFVVGAAPEAEIVPLRVTKPRLGGNIPAPILFDSGVRNLRDAIRYAVDKAGCHVISISLGWFGNWSLHRAIKEAEAKNVILCAASGNYVPLVVWPAAYREVIAVAGCNAAHGPWLDSSIGPQVDVSGPSEAVWVAGFSASGLPSAGQSSGTSFGVATVAGVAALWLAYHGRDFLIRRYHNQFTLSDVFRYILGVSSDPFAVPVGSGYGMGIVNARRVLTTPLPSIAELQTSLPLFEAAPAAPSPVDTIAATFPEVPVVVLRERLAAMLQIPQAELDTRLEGVEEELLFRLATTPALRAQITAPVLDTAGIMPAAAPAPVAREALIDGPLSDRLRARITHP